MLIYHSGFDIYHCILRLLTMLNKSSLDYDIDHLRILDFYLVFPYALSNFKFPREALTYRKKIIPEKNPYDSIDNFGDVFDQITHYQFVAINTLAAYGILDKEQLKQRVVKLVPHNIPTELVNLISEKYSKNKDLIDLLVGPFSRLESFGKNSIKDRSNLIRINYDTI